MLETDAIILCHINVCKMRFNNEHGNKKLLENTKCQAVTSKLQLVQSQKQYDNKRNQIKVVKSRRIDK